MVDGTVEEVELEIKFEKIGYYSSDRIRKTQNEHLILTKFDRFV